MKKNKKVLMIGSLAIIIVVAAAILILLITGAHSAKSSPTLINPPDTTGNPVEAFGVIKSRSTKTISTGIPATIARLDLTEGQRVKRGDTLAVLDLAEYNDRMKSCESEIEILERDLELLRKNYNEEQKMLKEGSLPDLKRLMNSLADSDQALLKAKKSLELKQSLYDSGSISQSELEDAETQAGLKESASRDTTLALENLKAAKKKELSGISSEITAKEDKLAVLKKELAVMKQKLNNACLQEERLIYGSDQGVVSEINCSEGMSINPGECIFKILDMSNLIIEAAVDEQFISMVKAGAQVVITPDADRSRLYTGKVSFISSLAVTTNGETTIPVQITVDDADSFLMPGLNAAVKIDVK